MELTFHDIKWVSHNGTNSTGYGSGQKLEVKGSVGSSRANGVSHGRIRSKLDGGCRKIKEGKAYEREILSEMTECNPMLPGRGNDSLYESSRPYAKGRPFQKLAIPSELTIPLTVWLNPNPETCMRVLTVSCCNDK
jgi:hypothetical protein